MKNMYWFFKETSSVVGGRAQGGQQNVQKNKDNAKEPTPWKEFRGK